MPLFWLCLTIYDAPEMKMYFFTLLASAVNHNGEWNIDQQEICFGSFTSKPNKLNFFHQLKVFVLVGKATLFI